MDNVPDINPFSPPAASRHRHTNDLGKVGLSMSVCALVAGLMSSAGPIIGNIALCFTALAIPGMIISLVGLRRKPRHLAILGFLLGLFLSLSLLPMIGGVVYNLLNRSRREHNQTIAVVLGAKSLAAPSDGSVLYFDEGGTWSGTVLIQTVYPLGQRDFFHGLSRTR